LILGLGRSHGVLVHLAAPGDQVDEHAQVGQEDDEDAPDRLGPSPQVMAAEDVAEDDDQQPDPDEEQEEPEERPEHLPGAELSSDHGITSQ
jgi:hypothetical protein